MRDSNATNRLSPRVRRALGGIIGVIGFVLSPLTWWNDLIVNVPLALLFAWTFSFWFPSRLIELAVAGYWLTNILGFVMLHYSATLAVTGTRPAFGWRTLARDVAISLGYTALIILLIKLGWVRVPQELFSQP